MSAVGAGRARSRCAQCVQIGRIAGPGGAGRCGMDNLRIALGSVGPCHRGGRPPRAGPGGHVHHMAVGLPQLGKRAVPQGEPRRSQACSRFCLVDALCTPSCPAAREPFGVHPGPKPTLPATVGRGRGVGRKARGGERGTSWPRGAVVVARGPSRTSRGLNGPVSGDVAQQTGYPAPGEPAGRGNRPSGSAGQSGWWGRGPGSRTATPAVLDDLRTATSRRDLKTGGTLSPALGRRGPSSSPVRPAVRHCPRLQVGSTPAPRVPGDVR